MRLLRETIRRLLLQEMTQKQSWRQVEKIITDIQLSMEADDDIEVKRVDRRNVEFMSKRTPKSKMGFDPDVYPGGEPRPTVYVSPGDWDPFNPAARHKGTDIIRIFTEYPWGTGEYHQMKIADVIADNGIALHGLVVQLIEKIE